jgi:hypothetical protein
MGEELKDLKELKEYVERLKHLGVESLLERFKKVGPHFIILDASVSSTEVALNPFKTDPTNVPSGPCTFAGYVVNAVNPAGNLKCSLYTVDGMGNVQLPPVYDAVSPAVAADQWNINFVLNPNMNYMFEVVLRNQPPPAGTPFQKAFFTTGA